MGGDWIGPLKIQLWLAVGVMVSLVNVVGCGSSCTLLPCNPRADLYFDDVMQASGSYVAEVETREDGVVTCEAALPFSGDVACSGANVSWIVSGPESSSRSAKTQGPADGIAGVSVKGEHDVIQVRLFRDGVVLGDATVQPRYVGKEINGPGCGECPSATEQVPMP